MNPRTDILLVDDEPAVRRTVEQALTRAGYRVECAADGIEAAAALELFKPRLVICDLVMPNRDGLSLIRDIRERGNNVKIIAVSGGIRRDDGPDMADATLPKPFGARELLRVVHGFLDGSAVASD